MAQELMEVASVLLSIKCQRETSPAAELWYLALVQHYES
jgi:hypothetical protein